MTPVSVLSTEASEGVTWRSAPLNAAETESSPAPTSGYWRMASVVASDRTTSAVTALNTLASQYA